MQNAIPHDVLIGIQMIRPKIVDIDGTEAKLKEAMRIAEDACFMSHEEDNFFKAAVGAVLLEIGTDHPDHRNLEAELKMMAGLHAAVGGVPVDFAALISEMPDDVEPLGRMKMWREREGEQP